MNEKIKILENLLEILKAELNDLLEMAETHNIPEEISKKQIDIYLEDVFKIMTEIEKLKKKESHEREN